MSKTMTDNEIIEQNKEILAKIKKSEDRMKELEEEINYMNKVNELRHLVDVQGQDGLWNDGQYHLGLYNGLEFALSIFEGREPKFRSKDALIEKDYRLVATNEEGRIRWVVDDWPMNCSLYMRRPEKIYPATSSESSDCMVDAYKYVTGREKKQGV